MKTTEERATKTKEVTFTEALEHMKAGNYAYMHPTREPYRVGANGDLLERPYEDGTWGPCRYSLSHALVPWFVEVEPKKHVFNAVATGITRDIHLILPVGWEQKLVRVTVEGL